MDHEKQRQILDEWTAQVMEVAQIMPFDVLAGPAQTRPDPERGELVTYTTVAWKDIWGGKKYGAYIAIAEPIKPIIVLEELKKNWEETKAQWTAQS